MEIAGTVNALLREKDRALCSIAPTATVYSAIELMAAQNIGSLPVVEGDQLIGLVTERDYSRKVILLGRSSRETQVRQIMSTQLETVCLDDTIEECMRIMTEARVRHLPVVEGGELVGILSMGDVVKWIMSVQMATIDHLTKYVFGEA